ncbi:MAG TPA: substrate-binding domain-containing protein [Noviherbaspirillum sp.]|nr:substrate-binding domain-containing protein [Noviherbaspirillum sp.]
MTGLLRTIIAAAWLLLALLPGAAESASEPKYRLIVMPKLLGIAYYDAVKRGVDEAARELPDAEVVWMGPPQDLVGKQIEMLESVIPTKPNVIAVAANDPVAIVQVMKKAQAAGIHAMSWDGDSRHREFFVNLVDFDEFGTGLIEAIQEETGPKADIAIITTSFTAPNQSSWIEAIKRRIYAKYPGLKILDIRPAGESTEEAYRITKDYLRTMPTLKGIIVLGAPNPAGAARAVKEAGLAGKIAVVGNSTPNLMRNYLKDGTVRKVLLWNAPDHGYLTVHCAYLLAKGELKPGVPFKAGRLGMFTPKKDALSMRVALPVLIFTKENVDKHHF